MPSQSQSLTFLPKLQLENVWDQSAYPIKAETKSKAQDEASHKTAHNTQPMRQKIRVSCSTWPSMKLIMQLIMLTNTQISTIIGILMLNFTTEPKDKSATPFKHYSYHAQWHKDEHENYLASPASKVWNISLYLVVITLNVIWVCVVEPGILGKVKSGILNIIVLRRIIDQIKF